MGALRDDLKEEQARVVLCSKLGLSAMVPNNRLPTMARVLELAWRGIDLAEEAKRESRYPSRWIAFWFGVFGTLFVQAIFGG